MRKFIVFIGLALIASSLFGMKVGMTQVTDPANPQAAKPPAAQKAVLAFLAAEIQAGHFVLTKVQRDSYGPLEHRRYQQMHEGLPVWGGEIIQHVRNGKVESYDGEYFLISRVETNPRLTRDEALKSLERHLQEKGLEADAERSGLVIFPQSDQAFHLAHKLWVRKPGARLFNKTALVDAETGAVLLQFSNIKTEDILIGQGVGQRGDALKFPTMLSNGVYYMMDAAVARPFVQRTFDAKHTLPNSLSVSSSSNNSWASDNVVNVHTYIGYVYDFFFLRFGLNGPNNGNMNLNSFAHVFSVAEELYDNAFWNDDPNSMYGVGMYFLDPYQTSEDNGAALDVVGHELSHAVTTYHANLNYYGESGALNESFSDVMGTATEFLFQAEGAGYNRADWYNGEDANSPFSYSRCRSQENPNVNSQLRNAGAPSNLWYPDPAHLSQKVPTLYNSKGQALDNDNVHINCTIFPHVFYLLARGGTNPVSKMAVGAVGMESATRIFYDAFVNRATSTTNFLGMANALLSSAYYVYGSSSNEYAQMKQALRAIGYTVN